MAWDDLVPIADLAKFLGLKISRSKEFASDGTFVRVTKGRYDLVESIRGYCARLREEAAGRSTQGLSEERARLAREQADAVAMKNAVARGEYLLRDAAEREWTAQMRAFRADALAFPGRLQAALPHLSRSDIAVASRLVSDWLTDIGEHGPSGTRDSENGVSSADFAAATELVDVD